MTVQCCPLFTLAVSDLSAASLLLLLWGVCGLRPLVFWVAAHCSYSSFPFSLFSLFLSAVCFSGFFSLQVQVKDRLGFSTCDLSSYSYLFMYCLSFHSSSCPSTLASSYYIVGNSRK